jgi:hypothetical protein
MSENSRASLILSFPRFTRSSLSTAASGTATALVSMEGVRRKVEGHIGFQSCGKTRSVMRKIFNG